MLQSRALQGSPPRIDPVGVLLGVDREPPEIATAYRTRKVREYWRRDG